MLILLCEFFTETARALESRFNYQGNPHFNGFCPHRNNRCLHQEICKAISWRRLVRRHDLLCCHIAILQPHLVGLWCDFWTRSLFLGI